MGWIFSCLDSTWYKPSFLFLNAWWEVLWICASTSQKRIQEQRMHKIRESVETEPFLIIALSLCVKLCISLCLSWLNKSGANTKGNKNMTLGSPQVSLNVEKMNDTGSQHGLLNQGCSVEVNCKSFESPVCTMKLISAPDRKTWTNDKASSSPMKCCYFRISDLCSLWPSFKKTLFVVLSHFVLLKNNTFIKTFFWISQL